MLKNIRKSKKGFTLTEMIVVLVIIVILIALLVPTLVGYIDKAKEKSAMAEGKQVLTAAQTITSESYGFSESLENGKYSLKQKTSVDSGVTGGVKAAQEMAKLAEMTKNGKAVVVINNNKVDNIYYTNGSQAAKYTAGTGWAVGKTDILSDAEKTLVEAVSDCGYSDK